MIRKGKKEDTVSIMNIIKAATLDMELNHIHQWDDIYPDEKVIIEDIDKGDLYVYEDDGIINALIVLNKDQAEEYRNIDWKYTSGKQLVIHRLCVDPKAQGHGIARKLLKYTDNFATRNRYNAIRLDAFPPNERAIKLYEKNGYTKVGSVKFRKGKFYCYEKNISFHISPAASWRIR
ncbi:MAG: GNAT family N-acetyltransferase [Prevotella sp.]|jgi:ribosomal protein S18 acetylase RimI-like enzyme|nr:GNAT family N-acetyltransferase [Prevotella sp.]